MRTRPRCSLFLLLVLAASGCGDGEGERPANATTATTTAIETASPKGIAYAQSLVPGWYATTKFTPRFTFRVSDEGWFSDNPSERFAVLGRPKERSGITFLRPDAVRNPADQDKDIALPEDLLAWLSRHPNLNPGKRSSTTVGGIVGDTLDAEVKSLPKDYDDGCDEPCVSVGGGTAWFTPLALYRRERTRFILLDVRRQPILIAVQANRADFSAFLAEAEKVLASVNWTD